MRALIDAIGPEGALLIVGVSCVAVASAYLSPIGPLMVVGVACILAGLALVVPTRK